MALVGVDETAAHQWAYVQLASLEQFKQLKCCTPFAAWWAKGDEVALPYCDAAGWAFEVHFIPHFTLVLQHTASVHIVFTP